MSQKKKLLVVTMTLAIMACFAGSSFAALLGVQPGLPQISFTINSAPPPYATTFDSATGILRVTASPTTYRWSALRPVAVAGAKNLTIQVHLDNTGKIIPNVDGDGIVVTGDIVAGSQTYTSTLLTGKITAFGFFNSATTTDSFEFRFTTTGGSLQSLYTGMDIGITLASESSSFDGNFGVSFHGNAKGTLGAIPGPYFTLSKSCTDAVGQGQPIQFSAVLKNSGTEALNSITCSSNAPDAVMRDVPTDLAFGASATITGSYVPGTSPSTETLTCSATGFSSQVTIAETSSATCNILLPAIKIKKATNGDDADLAPGPTIQVGGTVNWTYTVTNTGNVDLTNVVVTDDKISGSICTIPSLAASASQICKATGSATAGQYENIGTATGIYETTTVTNSDPSHYFGAAPAIKIKKSTNGDDADLAPGPAIQVGGTVNWTYTVTNTGNVDLTNVVVTDDKMSGSICTIPSLAVSASQTCTVTGTATAGQYENIGTATGTYGTTTVTNSDLSHYYGAAPAIKIKKSTNGDDADLAPGPAIPVGGTVNWTYTVTNIGNVDLTNVVVTDDKMSGSICTIPALAVSASQTCTATGTATAGQYENKGTATGTHGTTTVTNSDLSHYYGAAPVFTIVESCNNATAPGQPIGIRAVITNTGNETLTGFSCTDDQGETLDGVPSTLAPLATATITGSYTPTASPATDTIKCNASGQLSYALVSAASSATCTIEPAACIQIKKQVSTNCTVTGGRDKHCKTDESEEDHCKRGDCDKGYCGDASQSKQSYCREVTQKQAHCGSSEAKSTHCSKSDCDRGYCDRDESKDDYCKVPAAPVCVPVWLDADTQDTAATMNGATGSSSDSGDDLLTKLASGTYSNNQSSNWLQKLRHNISNEDSDEGEVHDADRDDDGDKSDDDDRYESAENYQGHVRQSGLMYRFTVSNCGSTELTDVVITDPNIAITNYLVGSLKPEETRTLTSDQIPQLAQPKFSCSASFLNTATVTGTYFLGRSVSASDDAWVLCNTKTCAFTQGYWKNHPGSWPVTALKLGSASYTQNQLLSIFDTPPAGNGLISLAHQLIAAKLNAANGTMVPTAVQQAIHDADVLTGALVVPPIGSGVLAPAVTSALIQTLDSYNSGTIAGGPTHCGDTPATQQCTGIIGDFVWNDLNKNGLQNSGEPGLFGVKVTLSNGRTTTTDASGHYQFTGLCKGSYQVKVTPPCNLVATTGTSVSVNLTADSSSNLSADFGFAKPALSCTGKIGDFVWDDVNKNGIQDSAEAGLSRVQLTLGNGAATVTDASGHYQFTGLCAGDYQVTVAAPAGYTASDVTQGSNPAKDSKGSPAKVTLNTNSSSVLNIDFGFYKTTAPACTGVIGNFIWNDLNKNGIQDCTEKGIAGVVVKLNNVQTAITDADGHYQFAGLCSGSYSVTATTPDGFTPSLSLQGSSRAADSNGSLASVTLGDNRGSDLSVDFGFWKLPSPPATQAKGCSLGYWKNHTVNWPSDYHTSDNFDAIFGSSAFSPDISLLQALDSGGGGLSNLARQGTAALLNAQDPRITGFPLSVSEVKAAVMNAILSGNYAPLASKLDSYNNLGCPLN